MIDSTPVMGEDDRKRSEQLSLESLRPPMRVPGYEQERFLGRGSFGEVWVAVDSNSGRNVAIKFYNRRGEVDWAMLAREVEKLRHLFSDRYVVQLLNVGWNADPPYYVMEYMENGSLEDVLRNGTMSIPEAVEVIREVAQGLVHAHGKGILHCDLKPGNVLLDQDQRPRLADFGQARLSHEQTPSLGTLFFMAPEQADLNGVPDARWDVYALGALLHCMLIGSPPYREEGEHANQLIQAPTLADRLVAYRRLLTKADKPRAHRLLPGMDSALVEIIEKCLAVNPSERYPNVQAVVDALDERTLRIARRPLLLLGALGPALVVLVMALAGWWLFNQTISSASNELLGQALQGNRFATRAIAERFALEIDRRWRILEREAADPAMIAKLRQIRSTVPLSPEWKPIHEWLQAWLIRRSEADDSMFTPKTRASYWFLNDAVGIQVARLPSSTSLGKSWAQRDYFHGQNRELPEGSMTVPIRKPHRSIVYRSKVTNRLTVGFSVPVWPGEAGVGDPVGVMAMASELGNFTEWEDSPNQQAILIDNLPVQTLMGEAGLPGMIVEHPVLEQRDPQKPAADGYIDDEVLRLSARLAGRKVAGQNTVQDDPSRGFRDPLQPEVKDWIVALEPVVVRYNRDTLIDTNWTVLVTQRTSDVLAPVVALRNKLILAVVVALLVVVLLVGLLVWFVRLLLNQSSASPLIPKLRKRLGLSAGGMRSGTGHTGSAVRHEPTSRSNEPPTVPSTESRPQA